MRNASLDNLDCKNFHKTRVVCSDHFEVAAYMCPSDWHNSRLLPSAIPTIINATSKPEAITPRRKPPTKRKFNSNDSPPHSNPKIPRLSVSSEHPSPPNIAVSEEVNNREQTVSQSFQAPINPKTLPKPTQPTQHYFSTSKYHHCLWRKRYETVNKKLKTIQRKLNHLENKYRKMSNRSEQENVVETSKEKDNCNPVVTRFIESQKEFSSSKKYGMRWKEEDIKLALAIFYKSPSTYKFLRLYFGLPSLTVLYEEIRKTMVEAGVCSRTLAGLQCKADSISDLSRYCNIIIDGMKIRKCLQYTNADIISGFEELGDGQRAPRIATEMVAVMLQGVANHWKQVSVFWSQIVKYTVHFIW